MKKLIFTGGMLLGLLLGLLIFGGLKQEPFIEHKQSEPSIQSSQSEPLVQSSQPEPLVQLGQSEPFIRPDDTYFAYHVAMYALEAIKNSDYESLSKYIHPEKGIVFVPYSNVNYDENLIFSPVQVGKFGSDNNQYTWGIIELSSDAPIELTVDDYFKRYVYDKDYYYSDQIAINGIIRVRGNYTDTIAEAFKGCIFIDFHDNGTEEFEGLDWSSIKIVLDKYDGVYKIVAITHSCYTL